MGDILHALPAVTALRQAHPEWVIDWVVEPRWRTLLAADNAAENTFPQGLKPSNPSCANGGTAEAVPFQNYRSPSQPLVDHLHFASTKAWKKAPLSGKTIGEIKTLRRTLRSGGYDAVLDLQGAIRSAVVGRMAGSSRLIGEAEPRERAARWLFNERVTTHGAHVIEQDVELASAVAGDALTAVKPLLPVNADADAWAEQVLNSSAGQPVVLINPGAGWGAKRWPTERYAAVAQGLIERGLRVIINAGPGEETLAKEIIQSAHEATAINCSLDQLIAVTRKVALVIAGDTGPLHLACALERPVVGIYGPTDPSRNGPFGTRFKVLRSPESRRDHRRHETPEAGLLTIMPDDVLRAADELLAEENAS